MLIDISTLADSYRNATASMHKAYEALIERYDVYVVAPAPFNDRGSMAETVEWVERYLSAPAHDRVVFANRREVLYGDYLITDRESDGFIGTTVVWGSDEFKTWEEIIVFFDRLGGQ